MVSRFNRQRFEEKREIDDVITPDDVNAVVTDEILQKGIQTLKHHNVIGEEGTRVKILVELFRRWLLRSRSIT